MGGFYMQYLESKSMTVKSVLFSNDNYVHGTSNWSGTQLVEGAKKKKKKKKKFPCRVARSSPHVVTDNYCSTLVA
jgi:hypothetical protein